MADSMTISENTKQIIRKLQQKEVTEQAIYMNLSKRVKKESDKELLQRIGQEEGYHSKIWSKYTGRNPKPQRMKVLLYSFLSIILGYTFVIKIMEKNEGISKDIYNQLAEEVPIASKIYADEQKHEHELIEMLDEERLQYVGSMVLGLNDALVELTGTLAGLSFALQNNRLVALSGLITGISATLSMASSEYLSARSEGDSNAKKSALYTGIMYIFAVILLVLPYILFPSHKYTCTSGYAIYCCIDYISIYLLYICSKGPAFKKRFIEMATISLSVAVLSFVIGILVNTS